MLTMGEYRFAASAAAYGELTHADSWRWPAQERIGAPPARQYLDPGDEEISLRGTIYPEHRSGLGQIDAMRAEAGRGRPLLLVGGDGRVWGKWCIARLEQTQRVFYADGRPRRVEFRLTLVHYGEQRAGVREARP